MTSSNSSSSKKQVWLTAAAMAVVVLDRGVLASGARLGGSRATTAAMESAITCGPGSLGSGGSAVTIHNNCAGPVSVFPVATGGAVTGWDCLQSMPQNSAATLTLPTTPQSISFKMAPCSSTTGNSCTLPAEHTQWEVYTGSAENYDISFNNGFNVGLTVTASCQTAGQQPNANSFWGHAYVPPSQGTTAASTYDFPTVVCLTKDCPAAYGVPEPSNNNCATQPCQSTLIQMGAGPNTYDVYLCNRPGVDTQETAGVCGCRQCLGITDAAVNSDDDCVTDGSSLTPAGPYSWMYSSVAATGADRCCNSCPTAAYDFYDPVPGSTPPGSLCAKLSN